MIYREKTDVLKDKIINSLKVFVGGKCVLWDVPHYSNIGDTLIWEGELNFLKNCGCKCLEMASKETCCFPSLSKDIIIFLQGGGNFGDLWREHQKFRLEVIRRYPENRIVIFPQSVYYGSTEQMSRDAEEMTKHPNLILCARDNVSYALLKKEFKNQILLVPDMAFCISLDYLEKLRSKEEDRILFVKRTDKELANITFKRENADVRDWPSMENRIWCLYLLEKGVGFSQKLKTCGWKNFAGRINKILNLYGKYIVRPCLTKIGVKFISSYKYIYTTRLHVMILSVLLGKSCEFFDNSYGKNSAFYETWLKDLAEIKKANG